MTQLRATLLVLGALALGALAWQVVRESRAPASWLRVEAPRAAVVGQPLTLRVTLPPSAPEGWLIANLHWSTDFREPRGFLSPCPAQAVTAAGGVFTFTLPVPPRDGLRWVTGVIFVGSTKRWADRIHAVNTEQIPVDNSAIAATAELVPLAAYDQVPDPEIALVEVPFVRGLIAVFWVGAAVVEWRRIRRSARPDGAGNRGWRWVQQHWLVLACLAAALCETTGIGIRVAERMRGFALQHHVYFERRWMQQAATLAALAGAAVVAWLAVTRVKSPPRSLALLALAGFAALSLAAWISQHEIDRLFAIELGPLPLIQVLKLVTAGTALAVLWRPQTAAGNSLADSTKD